MIASRVREREHRPIAVVAGRRRRRCRRPHHHALPHHVRVLPPRARPARAGAASMRDKREEPAAVTPYDARHARGAVPPEYLRPRACAARSIRGVGETPKAGQRAQPRVSAVQRR